LANIDVTAARLNTFINDSIYTRPYNIGCYYFPGWSTPGGGPTPSDPWSEISPGFPDRIPLLGTYDETLQSINDTHFTWMKKFGITFMALDWFMQWDGATLEPFLDHVLTAYKASTVDKPKLCLQFANQTNAGGLNNSTWPTIYNYWIANVFTDPDYFKIDGKPVVIMNSVPSFKDRIGTHAQVKTALDNARAAAITAGFAGIYFMGGQADSSSAWTDVTTPAVEGWDGVTGSNIYTTTKVADNTPGPSPTTYADLDNAIFSGVVGGYRGFCYGWMNAPDIDVFWPPCTVGFDNTPWNPGTTLHGTPTLAEWTAHLIKCKALLDANPVQTQRTFMIEAYTEFGEGSILEPTVGNGGFARSQILKDIFS
jgi:hypothetical protein